MSIRGTYKVEYKPFVSIRGTRGGIENLIPVALGLFSLLIFHIYKFNY